MRTLNIMFASGSFFLNGCICLRELCVNQFLVILAEPRMVQIVSSVDMHAGLMATTSQVMLILMKV